MRVLLVALCLLVPLSAQEATDTESVPALTDVQKLQLRASLQYVLITELRLQLAQNAFEDAKLEAQDMLRGLQKPGYTFDMQKMVYVPTPPPQE